MSMSDVMAAYDAIRRNNELEQQKRRNEVYAAVPRLADLHRRINTRLLNRLKMALDGEAGEADDIRAMADEARTLLVGAGFDAHYLDAIYTCPECHDTGTLGNAQRCDCFKKRVLEDKLDAARLTDNGISFEQFNLNLFDIAPLENGKSQRDQMAYYKKFSEAFADSFPACPRLLVMAGSAGLGKTYMTKCIMRRVIERGHTAAYYTAYRLFSYFHRDRIGEEVDLSPIFDVPLLIIDDLGTEPMTRNVTIEYFFDLLNERAAADLHTVVVTNLALHELKERYGERIHSRLMDARHSQKIIFKGRDVRY